MQRGPSGNKLCKVSQTKVTSLENTEEPGALTAKGRIILPRGPAPWDQKVTNSAAALESFPPGHCDTEEL